MVAARLLSSSLPAASITTSTSSTANLARCTTVRSVHDLSIKRKTGKPVVSAGPYGGGRNSVSGHVATVFGCTGFLGRYVVNRLAQKGTQVIVPYRDEDEKRHLKVMGDLGQVVPMEWDLRHDDQIEECLRHSDVVYNLTGRHYETKNFTFEDVNVQGAARIAGIAEAAGVSRLIHVSHLNATHDSPSKMLRSKAAGEDAVRAAFEGATIVRPGPMYGHEDRLLNQIATWPMTWRVNYGQTVLRPVHSIDVAHALEVLMNAEHVGIGSTFSLGGPRSYTINQLQALVEALTFRKIVRPGLNVPRFVLTAATRIGELPWWPMLSTDEAIRRFSDDLPDAPGTKGFADLGITPDILEDVALVYLRRYRSQLYFELPHETSGVRLGKGAKAYKVID